MSFLEPFFVVWNVERGLPQHRHARHEDAVAEAKRLALQHPGEEFYVLAATGKAKHVQPVEWTDVDPIPF